MDDTILPEDEHAFVQNEKDDVYIIDETSSFRASTPPAPSKHLRLLLQQLEDVKNEEDGESILKSEDYFNIEAIKAINHDERIVFGRKTMVVLSSFQNRTFKLNGRTAAGKFDSVVLAQVPQLKLAKQWFFEQLKV